MYVYVGTFVRVFVFSSCGVGGGSMLVSVSVFCGWGCFLGWWWVCLCAIVGLIGSMWGGC